MNWRDSIANATINGSGGLYFQAPGNYKVQFLGVKEHKGFNGFCVIWEFLILESDNPDMRVGSRPSVVLKPEGKNAARAMGDMKAILAALLGMEQTDRRVSTEITPAVLQHAIDGLFNGHVVKCNTWLRAGKNNPDVKYTNFTWSPVLAEDGGPLRVAIGAAAPAVAAPPAPPPALPAAPPVPVPALPSFPPDGWEWHPDPRFATTHLFKGTAVMTEADLRELQAKGQA